MTGSRRLAYLDYNATAPVRPAAAAAVAEALATGGNPSSVHAAGRAARRAVESARVKVAALVGAAPAQIVFTSGGTEANHFALKGTGRRRILVSAIEHDSVRQAVPGAETVPVKTDGVVDLGALSEMLTRDDRLAVVSLMLANNETGVLQPVAEAAAIARKHGALVHCDAVQAAGKVPVDCKALGVHLLTVSAHKLGGPQGVGALIVADEAMLVPLQTGGGQERGRRAGTENVPGIAGFGAAAEAARSDLSGQGRVAFLRDEAERLLLAIEPRAKLFGAAVPRLPNTICIALPGVPAATQVMALDLAGVMVSAGAACSSGKVRPSHVLEAMGSGADEAGNAIRISFGWNSTAADIEQLAEAWRQLCRRAQRKADAA